MPEQTQITEDQHYVPRFYIKQFSLIKRKKKKDRGFASFYRLSDGLSKSSIPVESCDSMIDILDFLDVGIVKFETSHKLIISDMPEIMSNPYYLYRAGINQLGTVIWFPASENILVVFYDKKVFPLLRPFTIVTNENDVVALNKYQILSAKDMIISEKIETLTDAVAQDAIISD